MTKRTATTQRTLLAILVLGVLPVLAIPEEVAAQPGQAERVERLTDIFSQMSRDAGVRIMTPSLFIDHGSFRSLQPEAVTIEFGNDVIPVELADIRTVQVEQRHPVKGTLWGLGAGLLVGSMAGLLLGSFYCDDPVDCGPEERRGAVIGGTSLGLAGGITGFLIGRYQVSWKPLFP